MGTVAAMDDIRQLASDALEWALLFDAVPCAWQMGCIEEADAASQRLLLRENGRTLFWGMPVQLTGDRSCLRVVSSNKGVI